MSNVRYIVAGGFAILMAFAVFGLDFGFIGRLAKIALRILIGLPFATIGLLFFSLFGSAIIAIIGLVAGVVVGATVPTWWRAFHWKGRLISTLVTLVLFMALVVYWGPIL